MRGWQLIGRAGRSHDFDLVLDSQTPDWSRVEKGDVVRAAHRPDGPMRSGQVRVEHVGADLVVCDERPMFAITGLAEGDFVFRATALGEDAFR